MADAEGEVQPVARVQQAPGVHGQAHMPVAAHVALGRHIPDPVLNAEGRVGLQLQFQIVQDQRHRRLGWRLRRLLGHDGLAVDAQQGCMQMLDVDPAPKQLHRVPDYGDVARLQPRSLGVDDGEGLEAEGVEYVPAHARHMQPADRTER